MQKMSVWSLSSVIVTLLHSLTLSLLGYLKNQGGVNLTPPPSKSHVWCQNMTSDTSGLVLYFKNLQKKFQIYKIVIFFEKSSYTVKMFSKKFFQKMIKYTFLKSPWSLAISMCNKEKLKMCKFPLTGCLQIIWKNLFVQSVFLCHRLSKKLKIIKI